MALHGEYAVAVTELKGTPETGIWMTIVVGSVPPTDTDRVSGRFSYKLTRNKFERMVPIAET